MQRQYDVNTTKNNGTLSIIYHPRKLYSYLFPYLCVYTKQAGTYYGKRDILYQTSPDREHVRLQEHKLGIA